MALAGEQEDIVKEQCLEGLRGFMCGGGRSLRWRVWPRNRPRNHVHLRRKALGSAGSGQMQGVRAERQPDASQGFHQGGAAGADSLEGQRVIAVSQLDGISIS